MTMRVDVGLLGVLAVVLLIGGLVVGRLAFGTLGGVVGMVLAFALSGQILRMYFERRGASSDHG